MSNSVCNTLNIAPGNAGQVLTSQGPGSPPIYADNLAGLIPWTDKNSSFAAAALNGYFVTATATATLPASPSQGDTISFCVDTTSILTIQANTGQFIRLGDLVSITAGQLVSTEQGDSVTLVYRSAATTWLAVPGSQGNWNVQTS